eukprot:gene5871-7071_t
MVLVDFETVVDMDIALLDEAQYMADFNSDYVAEVANAANTSSDAVFILNITAGSVRVHPATCSHPILASAGTNLPVATQIGYSSDTRSAEEFVQSVTADDSEIFSSSFQETYGTTAVANTTITILVPAHSSEETTIEWQGSAEETCVQYAINDTLSESGGPHFDSESGGPHFDSESGGPHFDSESGGLHFDSESGGPHFDSESGGPHFDSESVASVTMCMRIVTPEAWLLQRTFGTCGFCLSHAASNVTGITITTLDGPSNLTWHFTTPAEYEEGSLCGFVVGSEQAVAYQLEARVRYTNRVTEVIWNATLAVIDPSSPSSPAAGDDNTDDGDEGMSAESFFTRVVLIIVVIPVMIVSLYMLYRFLKFRSVLLEEATALEHSEGDADVEEQVEGGEGGEEER